MNLLHLEQFYEVAKAGSVTTGARKLRLSQPALSKSIRLLEEALGTRLFERTKRGIHLTPAGQLAFEHAGRIFSEARSLGDRIQTTGKELTGEFSLGASDNLSIHVLPKILTAMKLAHPKLRIQLFSGTSSTIKEELFSERCDAGLFFTAPGTTEGLNYEAVGKTEFWIVIAKNSPWAKGKKKLSLADLKKDSVPRIDSRHKDYAGGVPAHFHSNKMGLGGTPFLEANLHEVKKQLVLEGAGYCFLIKETVEKEVAKGSLIRIPTPTPLTNEIYWVTRKGRISNRVTEEFLERLKKFI